MFSTLAECGLNGSREHLYLRIPLPGEGCGFFCGVFHEQSADFPGEDDP